MAALFIVFGFIFIVAYILQLMFVSLGLTFGEFDSKSSFLKNLIPFYFIKYGFESIKDGFEGLIEAYRNLPKN
jgi:hypothetical protein